MKSAILSLNKGLFQQQARSITWIGVFFTLALVIMLPLSVLIRHLTLSNSENYFHYANNNDFWNAIFDFSFAFQFIAYVTFPVLLGIILVSFTTKKSATDFMHSLPFTRQTILTNTYVVGAIALLIPIVITGVLLGILYPVLDDQFYGFGDIASWMGLSYLIVLLLFIFTVMVGMFVGNGLLHAGLTYLMVVVPASLIVLVLLNLQYYVNGLALTKYAEDLMTNGVFFVRLAMLNTDPFSLLEYGIYTLLAAVFVAISYIAYTKRPSEATDQTIVFPLFRYLFLYVLTFFVMLIAGFYFSEIQQGSFVWTVVGYILGAFIAYTILQMIIQKTLRLYWPWKGFIAFSVVVALLIIPVNFIAGFYENAIPEASEVQSVGINNMYESEERKKSMDSEEAINQVIAIHEALIDESIKRNYAFDAISINYKLENGKTLSREYNVDFELLADITEDLRNNEEYKLKYEPIFELQQATDITYASVNNSYSGEEQRVTDLDQMDKLMDAIEQDVRDHPSRINHYYGYNYIGEIYFNRESSNIRNDFEQLSYVPIYPEYTNTIAWLKQNELDGSLVLPENIDSLAILPMKDLDQYNAVDDVMYSSGNIEALSDPKFITTDEDEISTIFDASQNTGDEDYLVVIPFEKGMGYMSYYISEENAPDFVKEALPLP